MSPRLLLLPLLLSLISSLIVFFLFFDLFSYVQGNVCIIIAVDIEEDDRIIKEKLDAMGFGSFYSESSQYVYIDNFGSLREIPLDQYHGNVMYFDPRDDGYANLLQAFFLHEGKRFFYLPTSAFSSLNTSYIRNYLDRNLINISYEFIVLGANNLFFRTLINIVIYVLALLFSFLFIRKKKYFLYYFPFLLVLGLSGTSSFILCAVLMAFWELLHEPVRELVFYSNRILSIPQRLASYKSNFIFLVLLFTSLLIYFFLLDNILYLLIVFALFSVIFLLLLSLEKKILSKNVFRGYNPILLLAFRHRTFKIYPLLISFALFFLLSNYIPFFQIPEKEENSFYDHSFTYNITAHDFYRHINFQRSFSYMPFGESSPLDEEYYSYYLDDDGLISGRRVTRDEEELPLFPLEELAAFLIEYKENDIFEVDEYQKREWVLAVILLFYAFADLFRPWVRQNKRLYGTN